MQYCDELSCAALSTNVKCDACSARLETLPKPVYCLILRALAASYIRVWGVESSRRAYKRLLKMDPKLEACDDVKQQWALAYQDACTKSTPITKALASNQCTQRTAQEIIDRYRRRVPYDTLEFEVGIYLEGLSFDEMQPLFKVGLDWKQKMAQDFRTEAIDYMNFARGKAKDKKGISAQRSIYHYIAWLWLMGRDDFDDLFDDYTDYGTPQLRRISRFLGIPEEEDEQEGF